MNYIEQLLLRQSQLWRTLLTGEEQEEQEGQEPWAEAAEAHTQQKRRREALRAWEQEGSFQAEESREAFQAAGEQRDERIDFPSRRLLLNEGVAAARKAVPQEPEGWGGPQDAIKAALPQGDSPADVSRQIQRDARRYDGGYTLY